MINEFVNSLALTNEKYWFYLDRETMTIIKNRSTVDGMDATYLAHAYPNRFLPLPTKNEIHTYAIMEDYVNTSPNLNSKGREKMRLALAGAGPFKRFKDEARKLGLEEDWLKYRNERFEKMAQEWCAKHHIDLASPPNQPRTEYREAGTEYRKAGNTVHVKTTKAAPAVQQIVAETAKSVKETDSGLAIALIEAIRLLFHMLDDESFERALDELKAALKQ